MRIVYFINAMSSLLAASYAFVAIDHDYPLNVNMYIAITGALFTFSYGYSLSKSTSKR